MNGCSKYFPIFAILFVVGVILAFGLALERSGQTSLNSGPAPDFSVTFDSGLPFTLSEQRGKIVFMNFWASWCGPCRAEALLLNDLYQAYTSKGVQFIGIGYLDNAKDAALFIAETNMPYPSAADSGTRVSRAYRVRQIPESYIIDPQGQIAAHVPGVLSPDNIGAVRALLDRLVTQNSAQATAIK